MRLMVKKYSTTSNFNKTWSSTSAHYVYKFQLAVMEFVLFQTIHEYLEKKYIYNHNGNKTNHKIHTKVCMHNIAVN